MKAFASLLLLAILPTSVIFAQGPLTPPAAPAPTMKTLEQIEPRIDLSTVTGSNNANHVISSPGSYYLSKNLSIGRPVGIEITSGDVTLDLMGFTISRTFSGSSTAIEVSGEDLTNITIRNGHISGPNISYGIRETATTDPTNFRVTEVSVSDCTVNGIDTGDNIHSSVDRCSVKDAGNLGIRSGEISYSTALDCNSGISAAGNVSHCRGIATVLTGIDADGNVSDSFGSSTVASAIHIGHGIRASGNVINSTGTAVEENGISAAGNVINSTGTTDGNDGISARNVSNSYGSTTGSGAAADGIRASYNVTNSNGVSAGGDGINAKTISYSHGSSTGTGVGLDCDIGIGCTSVGGETIANKYLMP